MSIPPGDQDLFPLGIQGHHGDLLPVAGGTAPAGRVCRPRLLIQGVADLQQVLADQQAMAAAAGTVLATSQQVAGDLEAHAQDKMVAAANAYLDGLSPEQQAAFGTLSGPEQQDYLLSHSADYRDAYGSSLQWGIGGDYNRALQAVTTALVGSVAGQGNVQVAANALAPYAAQLIGSKFDENHGSDPNAAAQLLSHALLGAVLAEVNGANAAGGALAGAGGELAAKYLMDTYPDADRETISALSQAIGALSGGLIGGNLGEAVAGGNVARNAAENNRMLTNSEVARLKELANGDPQMEAQLLAAACAHVKCSAGISKDDPSYALWAVLEAEGNRPEYQDVRDWLSWQVQTTTEYAGGATWEKTSSLFSYGGMDALSDWNSRTGAGEYFGRTLQVVGGGFGAITGALSCPETFGAGCAVAVAGVDQFQAGLRGSPTFGGMALTKLGLSPGAAELVYGLATGVGEFAAGKAAMTTAGRQLDVPAVKNPLGTADNMLPEANFAGQIPVRTDLESHLVNASVSGRQISGGHNMNSFDDVLANSGGAIVSKIEISPGIYDVKYYLPGKNYPAGYPTKTLYDPAIYSDAQMGMMARDAAAKGMIQYQVTGVAEQVVVINGVKFYVPINKATNSVRTVFPVGG